MHPIPASIVSLLLLAPAVDGWLGVYLAEEEERAVIAEVIPDSPAAKAGLEAGDVMLAVGDKETPTRDEFVAAIRAGKPGDRLSLKVKRGDKERNVVVKLGDRPEQGVPPAPPQEGAVEMPAKRTPPKPDAEARPAPKEKAGTKEKDAKAKDHAAAPGRRPYLGLAVRETADGVVVDRVLDDSPAKAAGVSAGDVVTSLGDQKVTALGDLDRFLAHAKAGQKVDIGLRSGDSARSVTLKLGERHEPKIDEERVEAAEIEPQPKAERKPVRAESAPKPAPRETAREVDLEAELAALRAELAKLRAELEELRKSKGRE